MAHRDSDSIVWIGYADFLTTLAILFFVLLVLRFNSGTAALAGTVTGTAGTGQPGCLVSGAVGGEIAREDRTDESGQFLWKFDEVRDSTIVLVTAACAPLPPLSASTVIYPGATIRIRLSAEPEPGPHEDSATIVVVLQGDALFERNEFHLSREGIQNIQAIGNTFRRHLQDGGVVAVQGHTDSVPFPAGSDMDNWRLSVNRAASAAEILRNPRYGIGLPECRLVVMGFGPTRPRRGVPDTLGVAERRAMNRRIEFRLLRGADLTGVDLGGRDVPGC